jgi:hypothetical protein
MLVVGSASTLAVYDLLDLTLLWSKSGNPSYSIWCCLSIKWLLLQENIRPSRPPQTEAT